MVAAANTFLTSQCPYGHFLFWNYSGARFGPGPNGWVAMPLRAFFVLEPAQHHCEQAAPSNSVAMPLRAFFVLELAQVAHRVGGTQMRVAMPLRAFFVLEPTVTVLGEKWTPDRSQCPYGHFLFWNGHHSVL